MDENQKGKRTPLYEAHCALNAQMIPFSGWSMPMKYTSQLDEHHAVRSNAGLFDVSHMTITDIRGARAYEYLRYLLANDVGKCSDGQAIYSCMLNHEGGILDDLVVYRLTETHFRIVSNAGTRDGVRSWISQKNQSKQAIIEPRDDLGMIAVQGPQAASLCKTALNWPNEMVQLPFFNFGLNAQSFISRTGYTGEDGFEIIANNEAIKSIWDALTNGGCVPCGLGARDTLRLEAGLNLYGQDMNESNHPFEANLGWTVSFKPESRAFIGREALAHLYDQNTQGLIGIILQQGGILRQGQSIHLDEHNVGIVTSGGYAPTLGVSIGLARVPKHIKQPLIVKIRKRELEVTPVKPPFVRNGQPIYKEIKNV